MAKEKLQQGKTGAPALPGKEGGNALAKEKGKGEQSTQSEINIGVIGHVDHGKTSLVQALTGKWTDTHSEELKRGISIRLGYADTTFYKCPKCRGPDSYTTKEKCTICGGKAKLLRLASFVDAPGHETLMATMLSGAALMDGAILVIAANEKCPQPRTAEHLMAFSISGNKNIVVAQNKIDLVDRNQAIENYREIKKFLKEFGYENAEIIPTAAHFGTNIGMLIEAIEHSMPTPKRQQGSDLRMYVVRSFDINKPGTKPEDLNGGVLGGSIIQGRVKKGMKIEIKPGIDGRSLTTTVEGLNTGRGRLEEAGPGGLIAVRTALDPNIARNDQMRGQVVGEAGKLPDAVTKLRLEATNLKRPGEADKPVRVNDLVMLSVGTMTALGTVSGGFGQNGLEIALKNPVVAEKGQIVAISKKEQTGWRLTAYGTNK